MEEALPGDTFKLNARMMIRLAPLLAPVMHSFNVTLHVFKIPYRLLWKDTEIFFTGNRLGTETPPVPPNCLISTIQGRGAHLLESSKLSDYLGLNPILDSDASYAGRTIDLLPFAAWYKCWYDYYRDRNYVPDDTILPLASGTTASTTIIDALCTTRFRDWAPDYFTTSLPWTQRGAQVLMPLVGTGTVTYLTQSLLKDTAGVLFPAGNYLVGQSSTTAAGTLRQKLNTADLGTQARIENIDQVFLTNSSVTINDFRKAERLQEYLERNALAGSRYHEWSLAHFAVRGSDARLQRAEYMGGRRFPLNVSEVLSTAWSVDGASNDVPQGNMSGYSKSFGETEPLRFFCEEHCFVLGVLSIMPVAKYMQGSRRMFFGRNTNLDYVIPTLAHLGEQPVYKYEIYSDATNLPVDRTTQPIFGYQSQYASWKNRLSSAHGDFRSSLAFWTMTRNFASSPSLGATFCTFDDALQNNIFAVGGTSDTCWIYLYNQCTVSRALPYFGTPTL